MKRNQIPTPALIIELDRFEKNIATMAAHALQAGVSLRPHAKTHKCPEIAHRLVRAGALGPACTTLDETEAMANAGLSGIVVTSPQVFPEHLERIGRLLQRDTDLMLIVDNPQNVRDLSAIATATGRDLPLIIEIDVGLGRTGCREPSEAIKLAQNIQKLPNVSFAGIQAYWGNLQQIMPVSERSSHVDKQAAQVRTLIDHLSGIGLRPSIVTGGGTGTSFIDPSLGIFSEIQPGSFIFLDSCYGAIALNGNGNPFKPSLFLTTGIVSKQSDDRVIVNAGYKAFATDSGHPEPARGAPATARYTFMGDEHGAVDLGAEYSCGLGDRIEFLTSHCDPTVNLHSHYYVVRDEEVVDVWPIMARGYQHR